MDKTLLKRINSIMAEASKHDWKDPAFSLNKAQVCAELAALVYEEVRPYELKKASRVHLFASEKFRSIVNAGSANSIQGALAESEFVRSSFIHHSRYAVVLGVSIDKVILLSVRGTVFSRLWDWKANVDKRKFQVKPDHETAPNESYYHRGFYEAIVPQLPSIAAKLVKIKDFSSDSPIVWTGHSLGGAMAAIAHSINEQGLRRGSSTTYLSSVSCYTFGMPRYAGLGVIVTNPGPYHLYKRRDLVPTVPLRRMGFSDPGQEYIVDDNNGDVEPAERTDTFGLLERIFKLPSSLAAHSIEGYTQSIAASLRTTRLGM